MRAMLALMTVVLGGAFLGAAERAQQAEIVDVRRIWDAAPQNAFTDLVRYRDRWFCSFRESAVEKGDRGKIRVITSADGQAWESAALLTAVSADLRDPKLSVTPKGELMLAGAAALQSPMLFKHQSLAWFSTDGRQWSEPFRIGDPNMWLWRVSWHQGTAYSLGYATVEPWRIRLYASRDGRRFDTLEENVFDRGQPSEGSVSFLADGTAVCLLRRDGKDNSAQLGTAGPSYQVWTWRDLGQYVGGPNLIVLPDGRLVAGGRLLTEERDIGLPKALPQGRRTALWEIDLTQGKLNELVRFPSAGHTGYPGLVWHEGLLWVSYYSSHEDKTCIYLAKVKLPSRG